MLDEIGEEVNVPKYVEMAKDKKLNYKIMGFGHRVYKNYDPRAKVMKDFCDQIV